MPENTVLWLEIASPLARGNIGGRELAGGASACGNQSTANITPHKRRCPCSHDLLATKLRTPLQIQLHLCLALEAGYLTGEKPVSAELVESVQSRQLDDLEPTLTRHGYRIKDLVEQFDARPTEIKALLSNALDPARAAELRDKMLVAGQSI